MESKASAPTAQMPAMPPELVSMFVAAVADTLADSELPHPGLHGFGIPPLAVLWRETLLPLSKVSWSWRRIVAPMLHRHLYFDDARLIQKSFGFAIHVAPQFGQTVRSLNLTLSVPPPASGVGTSTVDEHYAGLLCLLKRVTSLTVTLDGDAAKLPKTAVELKTLGQPIARLSLNMRDLGLVADCIGTCSATLRSLELSLRERRAGTMIWTRIFEAPHLQSLSLEYIDASVMADPPGDFVQLLAKRSTSLRRLNLTSVAAPGACDLVGAFAKTLECLSVHWEAGVSELLEAVSEFPRLRHLHICPDPIDIPEYQEICTLGAISNLSLPALESLSVTGSTRLYLQIAPIVAEMPSLRHLVCGFWEEEGRGPSPEDDEDAFRAILRNMAPHVSVTFRDDGYGG